MDRRLAAILIADVVGYSRLSHADEEGTRKLFLTHLKEIFEPKIAEHHGRLVKTMGDGLLIEFASIVNALRCAIDIQQAEARMDAGIPPDQHLKFRIGINLGDVISEGDDVQGDGVNIADRLQGLADPGGIVISGSAYDYVRNKLDVTLDSLGKQNFKNIDEPVQAYRVRLDGTTPEQLRQIKRPAASRRPAIGVIATIILIAIVIAGWRLWSSSHRPASATPSIAVLPFDNLAGDDANGRIAEGITEDVITELARFRDFDVIARNSTEVYKNKPVDVRQIGKDLNVNYVLEGSFQRQGDQVRITAQLIEAASGHHVFSERFDRPVEDFFAVQAEVAGRVANEIGGWSGVINEAELLAAKRKQPVDLDAYSLFLLGDEARRGLSEESMRRAVDLLKRAIATDPTLGRAHTSLAWAYTRLMLFQTDMGPTIQLALEEARRAIELDPLDARAHTALGYVTAMRGDLRQGEVEYGEALRLNPNSFDVLLSYSCWASAFGKAQEGAEAVDRAIRLNPKYPTYGVDCFRYALFMVGRHEDALRAQSRLPEDKWNPDGFAMTAGSLAALGRLDEAREIMARGVAKFPSILSIEKFAFNRGWTAHESAIIVDLMRKAGFPACAADKEFIENPKAVRLPECVKS
ncbi:adenylate/guanylate cyclase domain-containing protein [Nordella sp. HKS 07]|uniref:adenylate/guanylate cyclase domain-containing protein n=1 Tax=Nordella sp. HKS 07 TaxID=2712222 RepID=UPI0013E0F2A3|nr:adenylate/guanylate cyclase domain-containing protein [Nordella sp. HKS 07]QIG46294.1 adenylate/guanylate cyclase domain-containing protein [Nordella sp. HKS 07]